MSRVMVALLLAGCSSQRPPLITDVDGGPSEYADAYIPPQIHDAGPDASTSFDLDFQSPCASGQVVTWHFFDFQTHTPGTSAIDFLARTAATEALLDTAPSVQLATVTGPDITVWTGVDIATALGTIHLQSSTFLRITVTEEPSSDGMVPVLTNYRQQLDCQ